MDNKRRFKRVNARFDVTLTDSAGKEHRGILRDVAIQGIFVTCETSLAMGAKIHYRIVLHGGLEDIEVVGDGDVVRKEEYGVGVHFTSIDLDSVEHLRNIIAYNADDPGEMLEEMQGGHGLWKGEKGR